MEDSAAGEAEDGNCSAAASGHRYAALSKPHATTEVRGPEVEAAFVNG